MPASALALTGRGSAVSACSACAMVLLHRVDRWRAVADLVDRERSGLLPVHPRRAHRHARQRHALDLGALAQQPVHRRDGNMTADHIAVDERQRSEEHTSELQSLMRISYAV